MPSGISYHRRRENQQQQPRGRWSGFDPYTKVCKEQGVTTEFSIDTRDLKSMWCVKSREACFEAAAAVLALLAGGLDAVATFLPDFRLAAAFALPLFPSVAAPIALHTLQHRDLRKHLTFRPPFRLERLYSRVHLMALPVQSSTDCGNVCKSAESRTVTEWNTCVCDSEVEERGPHLVGASFLGSASSSVLGFASSLSCSV